jgi:hypothetical protein
MGLSRVMGNYHARFLGGLGSVMTPGYPVNTSMDPQMPILRTCASYVVASVFVASFLPHLIPFHSQEKYSYPYSSSNSGPCHFSVAIETCRMLPLKPAEYKLVVTKEAYLPDY